MKKNNRKASAFGEVRIIGGEFRGRKLPVLSGDGLRPTSDRVRETLFNWLQFDIAGARCLDAFSGSGALGLEALSRGAAWVTFLEKSPEVAQQLKTNLQTLKIENAEVICCDSIVWCQHFSGESYDGIFLDPPFQQALMAPILNEIWRQKMLQNNQAWLYLEQEKALNWPQLLANWQIVREKTTSQVRFGLARTQTD